MKRIAIICASKYSLTADEKAYIRLFGKLGYDVNKLFDNDVDNGVADLTSFDAVFMSNALTTGLYDDLIYSKLSLLMVDEDMAVYMKMASGGATATGTDITIDDDSHNITTYFGEYAYTFYDSTQNLDNLTGLATGAHGLDANDRIVVAEKGGVSTVGLFSGRRVFIGLPEGQYLTKDGERLWEFALQYATSQPDKQVLDVHFPTTDLLDTSNDTPGAGQDRLTLIAPFTGYVNADIALTNIAGGDDFTFTIEKSVGGTLVQIQETDITTVPDNKVINLTNERITAGDTLQITITRNSGTDRQFGVEVMFGE